MCAGALGLCLTLLRLALLLLFRSAAVEATGHLSASARCRGGVP